MSYRKENKEDELVCLINEMKRIPKLDIKMIEKLTKLKFLKDEDRSNRYFSIYHGYNYTMESLVNQGEYREPSGKASVQNGILILQINQSNCFPSSFIHKNFGEAQPVPSPPGQLEDQSMYLQYNVKQGNISFEFPVNDKDCLTSIIFDFTGK